MARHILLLVLLLAAAPATTLPAGGYDFPAKQWPNMVARLHVQVADEPDAAGFARVRLTVEVEGPATLEVEPPLLGDATDAWKVRHASAWHVAGGRSDWEETFDLQQVKAGLVPIPSVKVRCRESATAPWEEVEWTDILADVRPLRPASLPAPVPSHLLAWFGAAGAAAVLLLLVAIVVWQRSRRPPPRVLTQEERALAALDRLEATLSQPTHQPGAFSEALSGLLRRYVAERYSLPAPRPTTAEFLAAVRETPIDEAQREQLCTFLQRCDLVKFAGASLTLEECREMARFVRTFIQTSEQAQRTPSTLVDFVITPARK
jgi:hypothetical protein